MNGLLRWRITDSCGCPHPHRTHNVEDTALKSCTRREMLRTVAGVAAAAAIPIGAGQTMAFAQSKTEQRNYPPPPGLVSPIKGLMDTHVHSAPDVFSRAMDDEQLVELYRERGVECVVLKNHVVSTADRAYIASKRVPGIHVVGGIVLNSAVGGINPDAVQWMWRMQGAYGRVVWFPTFDSDNHVKHFHDGTEGIKIVGADGSVPPNVREVLKICKKQKLVVQTGHISATEALAVLEAGHEEGVERMVVTHAQFEVVNMSLEQMKKAVSLGGKLELCAVGPLMGPEAHLEWMHTWRRVKVQETAAAIRAIGASNFVLGTDLGQLANPTPADGLQLFVSELLKAGITKEEIYTMGHEVPGSLLLG